MLFLNLSKDKFANIKNIDNVYYQIYLNDMCPTEDLMKSNCILRYRNHMWTSYKTFTARIDQIFSFS